MPRVLVVLPTQTYRASEFVRAGEELGVDLLVASEEPPPFDMGDRYLQIDCADPEQAAQTVLSRGDEVRIDGVVAADDTGVVVAAIAGTALGLPANDPEAARAARDKSRQRSKFDSAEVPQPRWLGISRDTDPETLGPVLGYPYVMKPLDRAAGQGVIKVEGPEQADSAAKRIREIVGNPEAPLIAERYIAGPEVAVEGIIGPDGLIPLAIFDKPNPVQGEGFQETMLITPSRQPKSVQQECVRLAERAAKAIGLTHGPIHVELIVGNLGIVVIEVAARSIGGLCSKSLRFGLLDTSLETLILRNALGLDKPELRREPGASGVLMIPIPFAGTFESISGLAAVRQLPGVSSIDITVTRGEWLSPPPEGGRYLGFVFAAERTAEMVESTLTRANELIDVRIAAGERAETQ